jgi:hypothetical protein
MNVEVAENNVVESSYSKNSYELKNPFCEEEDVVYQVEEVVEEIMSSIEPSCYVENDGIGSYEYWGCRGYDEGTDYLVVEGNEEGDVVLHFDVKNYKDDCDVLVEILTGSLNVNKTIEGEKLHVHSDAHKEDDKIVLSLYWCNCS